MIWPIAMQSHEGHQQSPGGVVMNQNEENLPRDCLALSGDVALEVRAGADWARDLPGDTFSYDAHEWQAPPCSRVTVSLKNEDQVRHQWMVHGLPRYVYPGGMFHLEAEGGETVSGTFIVPGDDKTYLVHCDIAQHMEKGMKAQLVVGKGSGDLWSVPGISDDFVRDSYFPNAASLWMVVAAIGGAALAAGVARLLRG